MNKLEELEKKRIKQNRLRVFLNIFGIFLLLSSIILVLYVVATIEENQNKLSSMLLVCAILCLVISLILFKLEKKVTIKIVNEIKTYLITKILYEKLSDPEYYPTKNVDIDSVIDSNLYETASRFNGENLVKGKVNNINFSVSDLVVSEFDLARRRYYRYRSVFRGFWYIIDLSNINLNIEELNSNKLESDLEIDLKISGVNNNPLIINNYLNILGSITKEYEFVKFGLSDNKLHITLDSATKLFDIQPSLKIDSKLTSYLNKSIDEIIEFVSMFDIN